MKISSLGIFVTLTFVLISLIVGIILAVTLADVQATADTEGLAKMFGGSVAITVVTLITSACISADERSHR